MGRMGPSYPLSISKKESALASVQSYNYNVSDEREFGFAEAIKVGETIYVSGQLSHDAGQLRRFERLRCSDQTDLRQS